MDVGPLLNWGYRAIKGPDQAILEHGCRMIYTGVPSSLGFFQISGFDRIFSNPLVKEGSSNRIGILLMIHGTFLTSGLLENLGPYVGTGQKEQV